MDDLAAHSRRPLLEIWKGFVEVDLRYGVVALRRRSRRGSMYEYKIGEMTYGPVCAASRYLMGLTSDVS